MVASEVVTRNAQLLQLLETRYLVCDHIRMLCNLSHIKVGHVRPLISVHYFHVVVFFVCLFLIPKVIIAVKGPNEIYDPSDRTIKYFIPLFFQQYIIFILLETVISSYGDCLNSCMYN